MRYSKYVVILSLIAAVLLVVATIVHYANYKEIKMIYPVFGFLFFLLAAYYGSLKKKGV